jgi:hypothetical protein
MTTNVARALRQTKLLYEVTIERKSYRRRFVRLLIILLATGLAWVALGLAAGRGLVDERALWVGQLAAAVIILLVSIRMLINLIRMLARPTERLRIFNKGFTLERGTAKAQYAWAALDTFLESGRGIYVGNRPIIQWGAHTLLMNDKRLIRLVPRYGDFRQIARAIRPYAAEVTGTTMARTLRQEKPVRIHPKLIVWPGGLQVGKDEYAWGALNVAVTGNRLVIRAKQKGKIRTVRQFDTHTVDNLGGFMELATATIRNHRERA